MLSNRSLHEPYRITIHHSRFLTTVPIWALMLWHKSFFRNSFQLQKNTLCTSSFGCRCGPPEHTTFSRRAWPMRRPGPLTCRQMHLPSTIRHLYPVVRGPQLGLGPVESNEKMRLPKNQIHGHVVKGNNSKLCALWPSEEADFCPLM